MPGPATFKLKGKWKRLEKQLGPGPVRKAVKVHMRRASGAIGQRAVAAIRKQIEKGVPPKNAELTKALKGVDEPLIGDRAGAPFFKAITHKVVDDLTVFAGILQASPEFNLGVWLHEGGVIGVSADMRGMFLMLAKKGKDPSVKLSARAQELWDKMPGGWKPLSPSTKYITIPGRPFIERAFATGEMQKFAKEFWNQALAAAMKELSKQ